MLLRPFVIVPVCKKLIEFPHKQVHWGLFLYVPFEHVVRAFTSLSTRHAGAKDVHEVGFCPSMSVFVKPLKEFVLNQLVLDYQLFPLRFKFIYIYLVRDEGVEILLESLMLGVDLAKPFLCIFQDMPSAPPMFHSD
jgi:hypothetical protein